jgi:MFS family permease
LGLVAIFALSRPLLTATGAIAQVTAAEQTSAHDRAKAIALVAAGYGLGSGLVAVVRGVGAGALGFRWVFVLAVVPLALVLLARRWVTEPDRYRAVEAAADKPIPVLGAVERRFRRRLVVLALLAFAVATFTGPANSFLFVYAENVLGLSSAVTATMVVGGGAAGLGGLLAGRWGADRFGRRLSGATMLVVIAGAGLVTYSGAVAAVIGGYLLAVAAGSAFAPSAGALAAELFPTEIRATVAGWVVAAGVLGAVSGLIAFGAVADAGGRFSLAAATVFIPAAVCSGLFALLPETHGRELEGWEHP